MVVLAALLAWTFLFKSEDRSVGEIQVQAASPAKIQALQTAAENGDLDAQFQLGKRYLEGQGLTRDPEKARLWLRKAAARFHYGAQYTLARLYEDGAGSAPDFLKAAQWYELAARLGRHRDAAFALGQLYYHGRGVPQNPLEALKWYRMAAEHGHPAAQYVLGYAYETGWGVAPDRIEAYKWYTLATPRRLEALAVSRRFDPEGARENLAGKMTRFDRTQAERKANDWQPKPEEEPVIRPGTQSLDSARFSTQ
jgi:hypothetical protein